MIGKGLALACMLGDKAAIRACNGCMSERDIVLNRFDGRSLCFTC